MKRNSCSRKINDYFLVFPGCLCVADDFWLLPLFGHLSLRVHSVALESDPCSASALHCAMLWPQVCVSASSSVVEELYTKLVVLK